MFINRVFSDYFFSYKELISLSKKEGDSELCNYFGEIKEISITQDPYSNISIFHIKVLDKYGRNEFIDLDSIGSSNSYDQLGNGFQYGIYVNGKVFEIKLGDTILGQINKNGDLKSIEIHRLGSGKSINDFVSEIKNSNIPYCTKNDTESVTGPDNWVQLVDPLTGETYYQNTNAMNNNSGVVKDTPNIVLQNGLFFTSGLLFGIILGGLLYKFFFCKK